VENASLRLKRSALARRSVGPGFFLLTSGIFSARAVEPTEAVIFNACSPSGRPSRFTSPRKLAEDLVAEDAAIYDTDRIMFLRNNLTQLERAVADGVPVKATFNGA